MFGIRPGVPVEEGRKLALQAGFEETATPLTFVSGVYSFKLLVDDAGNMFGLMLEANEYRCVRGIDLDGRKSLQSAPVNYMEPL